MEHLLELDIILWIHNKTNSGVNHPIPLELSAVSNPGLFAESLHIEILISSQHSIGSCFHEPDKITSATGRFENFHAIGIKNPWG